MSLGSRWTKMVRGLGSGTSIDSFTHSRSSYDIALNVDTYNELVNRWRSRTSEQDVHFPNTWVNWSEKVKLRWLSCEALNPHALQCWVVCSLWEIASKRRRMYIILLRMEWALVCEMPHAQIYRKEVRFRTTPADAAGVVPGFLLGSW